MQTVDLIGQEYVYVASELAHRIQETLLNDDRISDVYGFEFKRQKDAVWVGFHVTTIFGELTASLSLNNDGGVRYDR